MCLKRRSPQKRVGLRCKPFNGLPNKLHCQPLQRVDCLRSRLTLPRCLRIRPNRHPSQQHQFPRRPTSRLRLFPCNHPYPRNKHSLRRLSGVLSVCRFAPSPVPPFFPTVLVCLAKVPMFAPHLLNEVRRMDDHLRPTTVDLALPELVQSKDPTNLEEVFSLDVQCQSWACRLPHRRRTCLFLRLHLHPRILTGRPLLFKPTTMTMT